MGIPLSGENYPTRQPDPTHDPTHPRPPNY
jgi:hypothetical protein